MQDGFTFGSSAVRVGELLLGDSLRQVVGAGQGHRQHCAAKFAWDRDGSGQPGGRDQLQGLRWSAGLVEVPQCGPSFPIAETMTIPLAEASRTLSTKGASAQSGPPTLRFRMWMRRKIA